MREELQSLGGDGHGMSGAETARELERSSVRESGYTEWQRNFADQLGSLEDRIVTLQDELKRESERTGDQLGTGYEVDLSDEARLRLEIKKLRLERARLIDSVPTEHRQEADQVRQSLHVLLPDTPI